MKRQPFLFTSHGRSVWFTFTTLLRRSGPLSFCLIDNKKVWTMFLRVKACVSIIVIDTRIIHRIAACWIKKSDQERYKFLLGRTLEYFSRNCHRRDTEEPGSWWPTVMDSLLVANLVFLQKRTCRIIHRTIYLQCKTRSWGSLRRLWIVAWYQSS